MRRTGLAAMTTACCSDRAHGCLSSQCQEPRPSTVEAKPPLHRTGGNMDLGLTAKRALVTGSTAGIGLATARALAREGAHVTLNGRTRARVDEALARLRADVPDAAVD